MRNYKRNYKSISLTACMVLGLSAFAVAQDTTDINIPDVSAPVIVFTSPATGEMNVDPGSVIEITFSMDMNELSINGSNLVLYATTVDSIYEVQGELLLNNQIRDSITTDYPKSSWKYSAATVNGTITYSDRIAIFTPNSDLKEGTMYTFMVTQGVENSENVALKTDQSWDFTTSVTPEQPYFNKQNQRYNNDSSIEK